MDLVYFDNVKSTIVTKKWWDVDITVRSRHTLEYKEFVANSEYSEDVTVLPIISKEWM